MEAQHINFTVLLLNIQNIDAKGNLERKLKKGISYQQGAVEEVISEAAHNTIHFLCAVDWG